MAGRMSLATHAAASIRLHTPAMEEIVSPAKQGVVVAEAAERLRALGPLLA